MEITIIICTHNRVCLLGKTRASLNAAKRLREWRINILVIANACTDSTHLFLDEYPHVNEEGGLPLRWYSEAMPGKSHALNKAMPLVEADIVAFVDDDETADPDWLCAYERLIEAHNPDAFGGRIEVLFEDPWPAWLSDELLGFLGRLDWSDRTMPLTDPSTPLYTGNFGFRRALCEHMGRFAHTRGRMGHENNGGEDVDFYRRLLAAGFKVWWTPAALIRHRIQAVKLNRGYFLDLHYRLGRTEAIRKRGAGSRLPPRYFFGQLLRACVAVWRDFRAGRRNATLRREMNVAYFLGRIIGWAWGRPTS